MERCDLTELFPDACACRKHRNLTLDLPRKVTDGLLIELFIEVARYGGRCCLDPEHEVMVGYPAAKVAEERADSSLRSLGYCCADCRAEIEAYWEGQ